MISTRPSLENYYRWVEPDSDITVCLKLDTVDRLQMDVLGGARPGSLPQREVGGILLGRTEIEDDRKLIFVDDFEPFVCEYSKGPVYAFTARETVAFAAALGRRRKAAVGYYRSHNRNGLFLSADDLQLIRRHFPGPDNLFLLIKTTPNRICTAGFFFWKDGRIQSEFTDSEAPLIPLSLSVAGQNLPLEDPVDEVAVPPKVEPELRDQKPDVALPVPPVEVAASPEPKRYLVRGLLATAFTTAAVLGVFEYRNWTSSPSLHGRDGTAVSLAVPGAEGKEPPPIDAPPAIFNRPAPAPAPRSAAPAAVTASKAGKESAPHKTPVPVENSRAAQPQSREPVQNAVAAPPVSIPSEPASQEPPVPAAVASGRPANPVPVTPEPASLPPAPPVAAPPRVEAPVTPALEKPKPDAAPPSAPPASRPAPAPRVSVGPRIIHQATPAIPRGVGPMITSDVQVDVAVTIDAKGKVTGARIASTKGAAAGLLTIEALKAAQLFRFQPAQEEGRDVPSNMVLTFRFARTNK